MRAPARAELPEAPKDPARWLKIIRAQVNQRLTFYPLMDELLMFWMHWDTDIGRNVPCTNDGTCPRCGPHAVRLWQGYVTGSNTNGTQRFVVEITKGCAQRMKAEGLLDKKLYGMELTLTRKEKEGSKNGPVLLVSHTPVPTSRVPKRMDAMPSLLRLWSWNEEHYEKLKVKLEALRQHGKDEIKKLALPEGY